MDANTHIIELPNQLIVLDTQYAVAFAQEAVDYAHSLKKPITRVYVSHAHPDHFFGAGAFEAPVYALPAVREVIEQNGETILDRNRQQAGDVVPQSLTLPTEVVNPGEELIEDIRFSFENVQNNESDDVLIIALPGEGIVLAQDLAYNNLHLYLAENHLPGWQKAVQELKERSFKHVLPGHGAPGGNEILDFVQEYLNVAIPALRDATSGQQLKTMLIDAFPTAGGTALLDLQNQFLFPEK